MGGAQASAPGRLGRQRRTRERSRGGRPKQRGARAGGVGFIVRRVESRRRRREWAHARHDCGSLDRFENAHGCAARRRPGALMTTLVLYDDARARSFEPFASTRPLAEMRAGTSLIRERWTAVFPPQDSMVFASGNRLANFDEPGAAHAASGTLPTGTIVANARFAPALPTDLGRAAQRAAATSLW